MTSVAVPSSLERVRALHRRSVVPCLMFTAEYDPGLRPSFADRMAAHIADLTRHDLLGVGHWIQQEVPDLVNGHLIDWLRSTFTE